MSERRDHLERRLEHYLDGRLDEADHREFESRLASDESLRAEVDLQRRIDAALRRQLAPPAGERVRAMVTAAGRRAGGPAARNGAAPRGPAPTGAGERPATRRRPPVRWLALAASIALAAVGTWAAFDALRPQPSEPYGPWLSFASAYEEAANGTLESWECRDQEEFAETFWNVFRQRLVLADEPEGVRALGLAYCHSLSRRTVCLLAEADGAPVCVFIDRLEHDRPHLATAGEGLVVHRGTVGRLVLYEVSPRPAPVMLDLLRDPAAPPGAGP